MTTAYIHAHISHVWGFFNCTSINWGIKLHVCWRQWYENVVISSLEALKSSFVFKTKMKSLYHANLLFTPVIQIFAYS